MYLLSSEAPTGGDSRKALGRGALTGSSVLQRAARNKAGQVQQEPSSSPVKSNSGAQSQERGRKEWKDEKNADLEQTEASW